MKRAKDEGERGTQKETQTEEVTKEPKLTKRQKLMVAYLEDCGYTRQPSDEKYIVMIHWQSHKVYHLDNNRVFLFEGPGHRHDITDALSWDWLESKYNIKGETK